MSSIFTIGVTGGRDYANRANADRVMDQALEAFGSRLHVVVGCCPTGLDLFIRDWCDRNLKPDRFVVYYADWATHGLSAGPKRNWAMANAGLDLLLAFPGGHGTKNMKECAARMGILTKEIKT
jgi:hypothetical protein